jgi:Membrane proteins related to metalloendopeptidases
MRKWLMVALMIVTAVTAEAAFAFTVSSPFGWRINPISHRREFHPGIDIPLPYGTPVRALWDGVVVWAGPYSGYGNTVILQHRNQAFTLYGHCARVMVQRGQTVRAGERIGIVGSTGYSTGSHLHLGYWINNHYVDPMLIWKKKQSHPAKHRPATGRR